MRIWHLNTSSEDMLALDSLRFFASAAIVFHHSHQFFWAPNIRDAIVAQTAGLALFVDLFFVISGFVIATVYDGRVKTPQQFARFAQRRIGRLLPLHLLTFVVAVAFWAIATRFTTPEHMPSEDPRCMALTAALLHAVVPCGNGNYFNGVSWSISAEMAMYAAYPLLAAASRLAPRAALGAILLLIAALLFTNGNLDTAIGSWTELYSPLRALPGFCLGLACHTNRDLLAKMRPARPAVWILLLAATLAAISGAPAKIAVPLFYLLGVAGIATDIQGEANGLLARAAPLGQLTYSIYLWHGLFVTAMLNAVADKLLGGSTTNMMIIAAICFPSLIAWSYLSWRYFETPARQWIDTLGTSGTKSRSAI